MAWVAGVLKIFPLPLEHVGRQIFASMFPKDVGGMVLVDPTQPDACESVDDVVVRNSHCATSNASLPTAWRCAGVKSLLLSKAVR